MSLINFVFQRTAAREPNDRFTLLMKPQAESDGRDDMTAGSHGSQQDSVRHVTVLLYSSSIGSLISLISKPILAHMNTSEVPP